MKCMLMKMNWNKIKKVLVPLLMIKFFIFVFFVVKSDLVSISREISYTGSYPAIENDSVVLKKEKLIRIVRNEGERGIVIKLRKKKNADDLHEQHSNPSDPIID